MYEKRTQQKTKKPLSEAGRLLKGLKATKRRPARSGFFYRGGDMEEEKNKLMEVVELLEKNGFFVVKASYKDEEKMTGIIELTITPKKKD